MGEHPLCEDCLRPSTTNFKEWEKNARELCGADTRMTDAKLQCAEIKLERLEDELADYNLIKNEPVVIGRIAVIKLARDRQKAVKGSP